MAGYALHLSADGVRIPADVEGLDSFRSWARSAVFPERGRIDWLAGELEVDMSPEDLYTHGTLKQALARGLAEMVEDADRGVVLVDSSRLSAPSADLSAEPDVVALLFESIETGRVRHVPKAGEPKGRFVEVEGAADIVVECVSDASVRKDTERLPVLYARAGVREYWLVDARAEALRFDLHRLVEGAYVVEEPDGDGFVRLAVLGSCVRIAKRAPRAGTIRYRLERRPT